MKIATALDRRAEARMSKQAAPNLAALKGLLGGIKSVGAAGARLAGKGIAGYKRINSKMPYVTARADSNDISTLFKRMLMQDKTQSAGGVIGGRLSLGKGLLAGAGTGALIHDLSKVPSKDQSKGTADTVQQLRQEYT